MAISKVSPVFGVKRQASSVKHAKAKDDAQLESAPHNHTHIRRNVTSSGGWRRGKRKAGGKGGDGEGGGSDGGGGGGVAAREAD
eukprot:scaffold242077_cov15-Tisochrysis_lutea.AAC.1